MFKDLFVHKNLAFQLNGCIPAYNSQKQLSTAFFWILIFELSHEIIPVKELQAQSSLKINSFKGMLLKFSVSTRLWNKEKQNTFQGVLL